MDNFLEITKARLLYSRQGKVLCNHENEHRVFYCPPKSLTSAIISDRDGNELDLMRFKEALDKVHELAQRDLGLQLKFKATLCIDFSHPLKSKNDAYNCMELSPVLDSAEIIANKPTVCTADAGLMDWGKFYAEALPEYYLTTFIHLHPSYKVVLVYDNRYSLTLKK